MIKLYGIIFIVTILGGLGYGAKYYYDTTQNTIKQLRENNAQLEFAVDTAQQSVETLQSDIIKMAEEKFIRMGIDTNHFGRMGRLQNWGL